MITVGVGDLLCITASQGNSTGGMAEVVVTDAGILLEIDPPELLDAVFGTRHVFKLQATQIPEKIKRAQFEWDFGDGIGESTGFKRADVMGGEVEVTISHIYEESKKEETYLGKDQVTVVVEPDDGPEGQWVLVEKSSPYSEQLNKKSGAMTEGRSQYTWNYYDSGDDLKVVDLGAVYTWSMLPDVIPAGTVVTVNYTLTDQSDPLTQEGRNAILNNFGKTCMWTSNGSWAYYKGPPDSFGAVAIFFNGNDSWGVKDPEKICSGLGDRPKNGSFSFRVGDGTRGETYLSVNISTNFYVQSLAYSYSYKYKR